MRKIKHSKWISLVVVLLIAIGLLYAWNHRYTPIDEWSGKLTAGQVEWVEVSQGYGVDKISYSVPVDDYHQVVAALGTVQEAVCTRNYPELAGDRTQCNMAFYSEGKLWLFHCWESDYVSLTFADAETGAITFRNQ